MKIWITSMAILCVLLSVFNARAQSARVYKYHLKYSGEAVSSEQEADYIRIVKKEKNDAMFQERYRNGRIRRTGLLNGQSESIKEFCPDGIVISRFPDGTVARVTNYINKSISGNDSCFYPSGKLLMVRTFTYQDQTGYREPVPRIELLLDSMGNKLVEHGNGHYRTTVQDFYYLYNDEKGLPAISEEGQLVNGTKNGVWHGTLTAGRYREVYENGKLDSGVAFYTELNDSLSYNALYSPPVYRRGMRDFYKDLVTNIKYPSEAIGKGSYKELRLGFTVDQSGITDNIEIFNDPGFGIGKAAIDGLLALPRWVPALIRGYPVNTDLIVPVTMSISN